MLCDVIFALLLGQSNTSCFIMLIFHLHDYHWQPNFSNHIKLKKGTLTKSKDLLEYFSLKLLYDVIFPSLPGQCNDPSFKKTNFHLDDYPGKQTSQITLNFNKKPLARSQSLLENLMCRRTSSPSQSHVLCFTVDSF